jgi:predicted amino acid racemase
MECARACARAGLPIGHVGHLVQIPRAEAAAASGLAPDYWTVFNLEKAEEAAAAAARQGREQALLTRIRAEGDRFYRGHEGGFEASAIADVAERLDALPGGRFAGITTFPALLFDAATRANAPTHNLRTLGNAATQLARSGRNKIEINAPGTTSSAVLKALADAGATQVEPGHGLTGTTPLHALEDLPEIPAVAYVSEVSHFVGGEAYCYGGGLYVDPVFPDYQVQAVVARDPADTADAIHNVEIPPPAAIDYYGMIDAGSGKGKIRIGDTVVFGFRPQIFVTRAYTVGLAGLSGGNATVGTVHDSFGRSIPWPAE